MNTIDSPPESWVALAKAVANAKTADPLAPVSVIAPTLHAARDVMSFLALHSPDGAGFVNVEVTTLLLWAKRVSQAFPVFVSRSEATALHREGAVRTVLSRNPGVFRDLRESPHTIEALARSVQTLEGISVPPEALKISSLASEVHRIHQDASDILQSGFYSQAEVIEATSRWLREEDPDLGTTILFLLEEPLHPPQNALYKSLREHRNTTEIQWDPEPENTIAKTVNIITAPDPEEEARTIARIVVGALDEGIPGHRILVAMATEDPYRVLIHRALDDAGVRVAGVAPRQLADQAVSYHFLQFLKLSVGRPIDPVTVLDALASGALETSGKDLPSRSQIERAYRKLRFNSEDDYEATDPNDPDFRDLEIRDKFLGYIADIEAGIAKIHASQNWQDVSIGVIEFLQEFCAPRGPKSRIKDHLGISVKERFDDLMALPDELASLQNIAPPPDAANIAAKLEHLITRSQKNRERIGHGVTVATIEESLGRDIDVAIVCGIAEGFAPPRFAPDPLIPEEFIEGLDAGLATPVTRAQRYKQHFFQVLQSAQSRAIVTIPRGDLRGAGERVPSRWLATRMSEDGTITGVANVPSQRGGYSQGAPGGGDVAPNPRERRIREGIATGRVSFAANDRPHIGIDFDQSLELVSDRLARRFSRFNGNLSDHSSESLLPEREFSPTSLERYATWPLSFFLVDVLDAKPLDELVLSSEMDALHRGTLIHKVLERFLLAAIEEGTTPSLEYLHELLIEESLKLKDSHGSFWVPVFYERAIKEIEAELSAWFREHSRRVDEGWVVREAEKAFGGPPLKTGIVDTAVAVKLDDGGSISFKGQVDRIDISAEGQFQVIDYKAGSKTTLEKLAGNPPSLGRTKFQLGVYGLFARSLRADRDSDKTALASYWFTKFSGEVNSAGDPACYVTISLDDTMVEEFENDIKAVVSLIQSGLFPPKTPEIGFDRYTTLQGHETVSDLWSGMQDSPSLAPFREVFGLDEEALE